MEIIKTIYIKKNVIEIFNKILKIIKKTKKLQVKEKLYKVKVQKIVIYILMQIADLT